MSLSQDFRKTILLALAIVLGMAVQCQAAASKTAYVAGGCFWCVESDFESVPGVKSVESGYTGGSTNNPTYKQVSKGNTGHFEAVKITYDPAKVSYERLMYLFFRSVDPTDAGGQFCDRGEPYRTAVFVSTKAEQAIAQTARADAQAALGRKIVTPILAASTFFEAEANHQNYYKGTKRVLTRRGPKTQADAYAFYRKSCGRDAKVKSLWGDAAPFASH